MNHTKIIALLLLLCVVFQSSGVHAQQKQILKYGAENGKYIRRMDDAMNKWRSNRFGQFIHWGLFSIPGGVWNGKIYPGAAEFLKASAKIADATWDSLIHQFNPRLFDATAWARMAKQMGVKYMTITTKHHEGFCMWPSRFSDFTIANTPYKNDILKQLVEAYNKEGIDVNLYYSVLDWHHPDWRYDIKNTNDSIAFARYLQFAKNQLRELAENYPTVKAFWFDGTWDNAVKKNGQWTYEVEQMLKAIHPGMIVNSRLRADDLGARHRDSNGELMGDYESGYERRLPSPYDTVVTKTDWEACMTIPENQWGYHKDWSISHIKSSNELIEMLVRTVASGGNFLLNFGPEPAGTFRKQEKERATIIGEWVKVNGNAIYNCGYAGLERQDWGYYTKQNNTSHVNMIVCNVPVSGDLLVKLPAGTALRNIKMNSKSILTVEETGGQTLLIHVPAKRYNAPFVISFDLMPKEKNGKVYENART